MDTPPAPETAPPAPRRVIRTFARREDAERAVSVLADHGIEAVLQEFRALDPVTGRRISRGCSMSVAPADSAAAARLVLKMPPSEAAGNDALSPAGPSKLHRRHGRRTPQRGTLLMIGFAMLCAGAAMIYAINVMYKQKQRKKQINPDAPNLVYEEDLNGDGIIDHIREYSPTMEPLEIAEDRNYDGLFEIRWKWLKGAPAYRDIDLDHDGKTDERATYDPAGDIFFIDFRPRATGPILRRTIFRDGWRWRVLDDTDADNRFDRVREYDDTGELTRDEPLEPDAPEGAYPIYPLPPLPEPPDGEGTDVIKVNREPGDPGNSPP